MISQGQIQQLHDIYLRCQQYTTFDSNEDAADIVADIESILKDLFD